MTVHESAVLEKLVAEFYQLRGEVTTALRMFPSLMTKEMCEERHLYLKSVPGEVAEERGARAFRRWVVPVVISLLSITIGVLLAVR